MGLPPALASAAVRFSLGKETTANEIECAAEAIATNSEAAQSGTSGRQSSNACRRLA